MDPRTIELRGRLTLDSGKVIALTVDQACTTMKGVDDDGSTMTLTRVRD